MIPLRAKPQSKLIRSSYSWFSDSPKTPKNPGGNLPKHGLQLELWNSSTRSVECTNWVFESNPGVGLGSKAERVLGRRLSGFGA